MGEVCLAHEWLKVTLDWEHQWKGAKQHEAVAFTQAKLALAGRWLPCPLWGAEPAAPGVSITLSWDSFHSRDWDLLLSRKQGKTGTVRIWLETSKLCCSELVSSLPSFPGDGAPAHTWEIGLPRAAGLQNPVCSSCPRLFLGIERRACFPFSNSAGQTPPQGRLDVAPCYQEDLFGTKGLEQNQESHPLLSYHVE